jgi:DNA-binding MarR family transcriptional regulator
MGTNMNKSGGLEAPKTNVKCQLLETFWNFWPSFQRWAESQTPDATLSPQRTRILGILNDNGPQIMSELRDRLGVTATNITALVDALEKDGLVERKPHATDRRATVIELASGTTKKVSGACSLYRERVADLFSALSEKERQDLLRMMQILKSRIEEETRSS